MNLKLAVVVFSFSFVVVIYVGLVRQGQEDLETKTMLPFQLKPMMREQLRDKIKGKKVDPRPTLMAPQPAQASWSLDQFKFQYSGYRVEQTPDGRVLSLIASVDGQFQPRGRVEGFHPQNREKVLAQTQAILSELSTVLGIRSDMPLAFPEVSSTDLTAQVVSHQTADGLPIVPGAAVSVIMGPDGALKGVYSSYLPQTKIINRRKLAGEGRPVLWVQSVEPVAQLRHAYETLNQGVQKVVDAEDNSVLLNRDKKIR